MPTFSYLQFSLVWGCFCCCHFAASDMQGANNWFTGRDFDFSITQHAALPGWVGWKQPLLAYIFLKTHLSLSCTVAKLLFSADCNELCCPLLELDDRGHVHFTRAAYCISMKSISRWVADLLSYPGPGCAEAQMEQQEQMGARRMRAGWDRAVCLIFNQWSRMLLRSGGEEDKTITLKWHWL